LRAAKDSAVNQFLGISEYLFRKLELLLDHDAELGVSQIKAGCESEGGQVNILRDTG